MTSFPDFLIGFHKFLEENRLKEEEKLSNLSSQKIAISGFLFLRKLSQTLPLNPCKGILTSHISQQIQSLNQFFINNGVKYVLVFSGLGDFETSFYLEYKTELKAAIREMWKSIIKREYDQSFDRIKGQYPFYHISPPQTFQILDELNIEYVIAPYHEYAQMRRLYTNDFVNAIVCDLDFLSFCNGLPNFYNMIIDFDFSTGKFTWIEIKKVLSKLQITQEQMNEFFLLAGIFNMGPLIKLPETKLETSLFEYILAAERKKETLANLMDANVLKLFYHDQRKKLESVPILTGMCDIELFTYKDIPDKMKDLFGAFLPLQVYLSFCFGLLSKELVFALSKGRIYSKIPIADSLELRTLIETEFIEIYKKSLGILTQGLSNSYKKQGYNLYKYYEIKDKPTPLTGLVSQIPKVYPSGAFIKKNLKNNSSKESFAAAIKVFLGLIIVGKSPEKDGKDHSNSETTSPVLTKPCSEEKQTNAEALSSNLNPSPTSLEEVACYSRLLLLHSLNLLNLETKQLTVLGSGFRRISGSSEESILTLVELMKSSISHIFGKPICDACKIRKLSLESSPLNSRLQNEDKLKEEFNLNVFLNVLENLKDEEKKSLITCVSRIFAFVNPSANYQKLRNFYDYDSSQYLAILQYTQSRINELYEAIIFNIFVSGQKKEKGFAKLFLEDVKKTLGKSFKASFQIELAILVKIVLQMKDKKELDAFFGNDEKVLSAVKSDLERGVKLWDETIGILKYQEKKGEFNQELNRLFMRSDELLKSKFRDLKIL